MVTADRAKALGQDFTSLGTRTAVIFENALLRRNIVGIVSWLILLS